MLGLRVREPPAVLSYHESRGCTILQTLAEGSNISEEWAIGLQVPPRGVLALELLWHGPVQHPHKMQILLPCLEGLGQEPQFICFLTL